MNDTLKVAGRIGAELGAVKAECEKLRRLLRELDEAWNDHDGRSRFGKLMLRVEAALSQQAEPRCEYCDGTGDIHRPDGEWLGECKECVKPAPAQDERDAFERAFTIQEGVYWSEEHQSYRSLNGRAIEESDAIDASMWWAGWKARAALAPAAQTEQQPAYVECRECTDCGHVGINDAHPTDATCAMCDWSGPSPVEDQCPDCGKENAMGAACPKCSGRYRILAETHVAAPIAQTALSAVTAERDRLRDAAGKAIAWLDAEQNGSGVGINRRLKLCRDAENSLREAMAAKEA